MIREFFIVINEDKDPSDTFAAQILSYLGSRGVQGRRVRLPEDTDLLREAADPESACLLVCGGDGTVLRASHAVQGTGIPILGINLGHTGFLTEVDTSTWQAALQKVLSGDCFREERMLLAGCTFTGAAGTTAAGVRGQRYALNDIVLIRSGALRVIDFRITVDDQLLYSVSADGIVLSTPTGSTAYNYSAGGPIVQPTAQLILITPICPHTISTKSIVLSAEDHIAIEIQAGRAGEEGGAEIYYDGISDGLVLRGDRLEVSRAEQTVQLLRLEKRSFIQTVHEKMQS